MKLTKEVILQTLKENKKEIRKFGVENITLFGSYAKDLQNENSDIDFLVQFRKNRGNYRDKLDLLHFLEDLFDKKIDIGTQENIRDSLKPHILGDTKYETRV